LNREPTRSLRRSHEPPVFATVLTLLLLTTLSHSFAAVSPDPAQETRTTVSQALAILHNSSITPEQRRHEVKKLVESKLDFARMARGSLGRHWNELTPAQRDRFVSLFAGFFEAAYLSQIQDYTALDIRITHEAFSGNDYASVDAIVSRPGADDLPIEFMLARHGSDWKVYDVAVENVGMIENYRAQFDRVIRAHGIARLMADMQAKQAQLGAGLGNRAGAS
jgi:phospholipid transport system substrate-binding protein